jgi:hypothetical protein
MFESKMIKLSHETWHQSEKISCLYSEGHGFNSQPGDRIPWLKYSGIFLSSLKSGHVTVQSSQRQPPFTTCVSHIHCLIMVWSTRFCIHMISMNMSWNYVYELTSSIAIHKINSNINTVSFISAYSRNISQLKGYTIQTNAWTPVYDKFVFLFSFWFCQPLTFHSISLYLWYT